MRTNIVIDDDLMNQALLISGCKTKKEAVEEGLKLLIAQRNQFPGNDNHPIQCKAGKFCIADA